MRRVLKVEAFRILVFSCFTTTFDVCIIYIKALDMQTIESRLSSVTVHHKFITEKNEKYALEIEQSSLS